MDYSKAAMFIVAGLLVLTALGNAWALLAFAAVGLACVWAAGRKDGAKRARHLLVALLAGACAVAIGLMISR